MAHPIEGLMKTAMESIKDMVDVNTIVGDAVHAADGSVIIPVSRVSFGFAAGGGEYHGAANNGMDHEDEYDQNGASKYPFAGGNGAGVSIVPMAFLVVGQGQIKLLHVDTSSALDRIVDLVPEVLQKIKEVLERKIICRAPVNKAEDVHINEDLT